jgi:large subunit ribosomal protein L6
MSRLIKKSIMIPDGVTIREDGKFLVVKGPKGEQKVAIVPGAKAKLQSKELWVEAEAGAGAKSAAAGTLWSLAKNAVEGVTEGFVKVLEIEGVGYRAVLEGKELVLYLGYALPVRVAIPAGVAVVLEKNTIKMSGIEKELVGRVAAEIRALKKPEPYKGKGIHYQGEVIRRKVGKKAGATATA